MPMLLLRLQSQLLRFLVLELLRSQVPIVLQIQFNESSDFAFV